MRESSGYHGKYSEGHVLGVVSGWKRERNGGFESVEALVSGLAFEAFILLVVVHGEMAYVGHVGQKFKLVEAFFFIVVDAYCIIDSFED
jgi:hypothetical protein